MDALSNARSTVPATNSIIQPPEPAHELSVSKLCRMCNPLRAWAELESPITRKEVEQCVKEGRQALVETPLWTALLSIPERNRPSPQALRDNHIRKIAWFVVNGVRDPIDLDVGVPALGCWVDHVIEDGHHRLAGAWIRGDRTIRAQVSGSIDHATELGLWNPVQAPGSSNPTPASSRRPRSGPRP